MRLPLGARLLPRLATYVVVASCMALQLGGTIHLAVVQHAICAEHGEAIDVGRAHRHVPAPAADGRERRLHAGLAGHDGAPADPSHHHCALEEDRSTHALAVHAALVGPRIASLTALAPPHAPLAVLAPRALRLLAPKTSPPA